MGVQLDLLAEIRRRVESGEIPRRGPVRVFGGYNSSSAVCDACGRTIGSKEVLIEIEFPATRSAPLRIARMHRKCHELWRRALEVERA